MVSGIGPTIFQIVQRHMNVHLSYHPLTQQPPAPLFKAAVVVNIIIVAIVCAWKKRISRFLYAFLCISIFFLSRVFFPSQFFFHTFMAFHISASNF
jgi:hypothetical protein